MRKFPAWSSLASAVGLGLALAVCSTFAASPEQVITTKLEGRVTSIKSNVFHQPVNTPEYITSAGQWLVCGDGLRTALGAKATVELANRSPLYLRDLTRLQITCDPVFTNVPVVRVLGGQTYVINRGPTNAPLRVETRLASAVPKGTEFLVRVDEATGQTDFVMFDGELAITTTKTNALVRSGQQGVVSPDSALTIRPVLEAINIVQWWIYYPAVLDVDELALSDTENEVLASSIAAYRSGDLQQALQTFPGYPNPSEPLTDAQRNYLAALMLAAGAVDRAEALLAKVDLNNPLARALRTMIAAVQSPIGGQTRIAPEVGSAASASELLALSYAHQARHDLKAALAAAQAASTMPTDRASPPFPLNGERAGVRGETVLGAYEKSTAPSQHSSNGFAWARVAELEFSFGHTPAAKHAVERALKLSPRNAQAHVVRGFLLAAEYKFHQAITAFDQAIDIDPALGAAWLGRGLCKRRIGSYRSLANRKSQIASPSNSPDWLSDLHTAAALEPRRSLYRSYAGKAFADSGDYRLAHKEFVYAKELDAADPTPWLYTALTLWEQHRVNEAITNLEHSIALNDNRAVYRSQLLLDQDRAVRSASLAKIYRDAGLEAVALREAARAVNSDYANHAAHQFLAESYDALRDPTRFNLRYETVWFNELLLANLLSPVGVGLLSQNISQQEYSRLFERDRFGLLTSTEVRSDGQYRTIASQSGQWGRSAYTLDLDYQHNNGTRPNNDLDRIEWYSQFKHQLNDRDSVFLLAKYQDYESGDNFQHYDPRNASRTLRFTESQAPIVLGALHREWRPGVHTTVLAGRLRSSARSRDQAVVMDLQSSYDSDLGYAIYTNSANHTEFTATLVELNQVWQSERHVNVIGARLLVTDTDVISRLAGAVDEFTRRYYGTNHITRLASTSTRWSAYDYHTWEVADGFRLTGGLAYDRVEYPSNFRSALLSGEQAERGSLSPRAGFSGEIARGTTLRGMYSRSVGGLVYDESVRLEPAQLAGFPQTHRNIIPEDEAGSTSAGHNHIGAAAIDVKLPGQTFLGIEGHWRESRVNSRVGIFRSDGSPVTGAPRAVASSTPLHLRYRERALGVMLHRLIGPEWSWGIGWQWSQSELGWQYPDISPSLFRYPSSTERAQSHQIHTRLLYHHSSGFFAKFHPQWYLQRNAGYPSVAHPESRPDKSHFQLDLFAGWHFFRRRAEIQVGCLNATGQDYRLNSLSPHAALPRERVWTAGVRFEF